MRRRICCVLLAGICALAAAQEEEILRAARYLSGAGSEEEIPQEWIQELERASRVRVNSPRLRPGPLLSAYQVASILDYRERAGDILSFEELMLVDGFDRAAVDALKPFLILDRGAAADTSGVQGTALVRYASGGVGGKIKAQWRQVRAGGAWRGREGTFYGEYTLWRARFVLGNYKLRFGQGLLLWDGFSMSSLSTVDAFVQRATGVSPVWSFSPADVKRGGAAEWISGPWQAAAFIALGGSWLGAAGAQGSWLGAAGVQGSWLSSAGVQGSWLGRWGQLGAAVIWQDGKPAVSLQGFVNHKGLSAAWEGAWKSGSLAGKAALRWRLADALDLAFQARAVPSRFSGKKQGEYGLAAGMARSSGRWVPLQGKSGFGSSVVAHQLSLTADASLLPLPGEDPRRLQVRVYGTWQWQLSPLWALELRLTERYRSYEPSRTSLRADLRLGSGPWLCVLRLEAVHSSRWGNVVQAVVVEQGNVRGGTWDALGDNVVQAVAVEQENETNSNWGALGYLEGGYKGERLSAYLRLTGFSVSDWAARIYCYERDAPGTFSVPAYSGRGIAISAYGGWKHRFPRWFTLKFYLRAAFTWRPGHDFTPTLRVQLQAER